MSIIYESLKKIEKEGTPTPHPIPNAPETQKTSGLKLLKLISFYGIFSLIGAAACIFAFKVLLSHPAASKKIPATAKNKPIKQIPVKMPIPLKEAPAYPSSLKIAAPPTLNGIFFSSNLGYALINNQIVKEGDMVEGAIVQKISEDEVELKDRTTIIKLSTRSR
ncbi:MAG: hypothetical protein NTU54_04370 [Candidatus Omnitrophica bacterium]|nr:hypothetical protein [Candidatus Omnitrophota bacterium]